MCFKVVEFLICSCFFSLFMLLAGCNDNPVNIAIPPLESPEFEKIARIYPDSTCQMIRGFGGVNMPGWPDQNITDLTPEQVQTAFGSGPDELGFSILRIRVPYDKSQFYLEVPTAKKAASLGATVIASPWTPPPSMKTNDSIIGGTIKEESFGEYALHLKSFVEYMAENGISLYAVSVQNEPDAQVPYESCEWNPSQLLTFIREYAQNIGTRIMTPESYFFNHDLYNLILDDSVAASHISIIAGHLYYARIQPYPRAVQMGKEFWMTEHLYVDQTWQTDMNLVYEIHDCLNSGMSAYLWWYIRRFYGPINDDGLITRRGHLIGQYSRFVKPGFFRVMTNKNGSPQENVCLTAYKNGAKVVIVAINFSKNPIDQTFFIQKSSVKMFRSYETSQHRNFIERDPIIVKRGLFSATLEAESVTTFVSD